MLPLRTDRRPAGAVALYGQLVDSLHAALQSQAVIEQDKGILHAEFGVPPAEAFRLLARVSQNTNRKLRGISADLVEGRIDRETFRPAPAPGA